MEYHPTLSEKFAAPPEQTEFEKFFDLSLDLLCIAGTDGYFRRINPAFEKTLGYTLEEFLERPFLDFVHPDDQAATRAEVEKLAAGAPTIYFENRYRCKDGTYQWFAWKCHPTLNGTLYAGAHDVSGLKQAEAALRESEARARAILETTVDAIITINEQGWIEAFNTAAEKIFGYNKEEVMGKNVSLLMPSPYREEHNGYVQNYLETGHRKIIGIGREVVGQRKDGSTFPMELAVSEVNLNEGRRLFSAIIRDITRRKKAEDALLLSEKRLCLLHHATSKRADSFENHLHEVLSLTTELLEMEVGVLSRIEGDMYTIVACSSPALQPGQTFDLGQTYCSLTLEANDVVTIDHMAASAHQRHPCYAAFGFESYIGIPTTIGEVGYGTLSFSSSQPKQPPFTESDREFIWLLNLWVASALARKKAEDALRESEAKNKALLNAIPDLIVQIHRDGTFLDYRAKDESKLAVSLSYFLGKKMGELFTPSFAQQVMTHVERALETGALQIFEYQLPIGHDVHDFEVRIMVSGDHETICIVRDITERIEAERQRARFIEELESVNQDLNAFAYIVSHDLKAPLRAIGSLASWIHTDYADRLDEEGKEKLDLLVGRVKRMNGLIEGILQYSRAGRMKERKIEVDLDELVRDVIELLAPPPHIHVEIESELPTLHCEPTRTAQVFQNLLSNAVKYMDKPQGEIRVACEAVGRFWQFSITDNGPGIEPAYFGKIFQLFQTLAPRDHVEGTGVGLAIIKKIVEMNDGRIWLESDGGSGTTFYFTLPMQPTPATTIDDETR